MLQRYLKAIFAAATAGLGALATILVGPTATFADITDGQWVTVAIVTLGALGVVWAVPNTTTKP